LGAFNAQAEAIFHTPVADTKLFHCFKRSGPDKQTPYAPSIKSVTISDIQRWRQDPERFYRESLLKIKSPEVTHQQVWGMAIHTMMEHLVRSCPVTDVYSVAQLAQAMKELASVYLPPMMWWQEPLLSDMWDQAAAMEHVMRQGVVAVLTETSGAFDIHAPSGDTCRLWGRADRLNIKEDGSVDIIDYKTGAVPTFVAMERFESVQLPLEGWLVTKGGMARHEDGSTRLVSGMAWWSFHWRKGCSIKRYPRCASSLVSRYDQILPVWGQQLITGSYMTNHHASETTAPPATSLSSGHNDSAHKPACV
jgi:RecB family exonuclease